jgi:hypothetical protein
MTILRLHLLLLLLHLPLLQLLRPIHSSSVLTLWECQASLTNLLLLPQLMLLHRWLQLLRLSQLLL